VHTHFSMQKQGWRTALASVLAALWLSACGGGGGGDSASVVSGGGSPSSLLQSTGQPAAQGQGLLVQPDELAEHGRRQELDGLEIQEQFL